MPRTRAQTRRLNDHRWPAILQLPRELRFGIYELLAPERGRNWFIVTAGSTSTQWEVWDSLRTHGGRKLEQHRRMKNTCALMQSTKYFKEEMDSGFRASAQTFTLILECQAQHHIFTATTRTYRAIQSSYGAAIEEINIVVAAEHGFEGLDAIPHLHGRGGLLQQLQNLRSVRLSVVSRTPDARPQPEWVDRHTIDDITSDSTRESVYATVRLIERLLPSGVALDFNDPIDVLDSRELKFTALLEPSSLKEVHTDDKAKTYGTAALAADEERRVQLEHISEVYKDIGSALASAKDTISSMTHATAGWSAPQRKRLYDLARDLESKASAYEVFRWSRQ